MLTEHLFGINFNASKHYLVFLKESRPNPQRLHNAQLLFPFADSRVIYILFFPISFILSKIVAILLFPNLSMKEFIAFQIITTTRSDLQGTSEEIIDWYLNPNRCWPPLSSFLECSNFAAVNCIPQKSDTIYKKVTPLFWKKMTPSRKKWHPWTENWNPKKKKQ